MIARIQNALCWLPKRAAQPTQNVPTTKTTCVRTRSNNPSSFLKTALRASTSRAVVVVSVFIGALQYTKGTKGQKAHKCFSDFLCLLFFCAFCVLTVAIGPHRNAFREQFHASRHNS